MRIVRVVIAGSLLWACAEAGRGGASGGGEGTTCSTTEDCAADLFCVESTCLAGCDGPIECGPDSLCALSVNAQGEPCIAPRLPASALDAETTADLGLPPPDASPGSAPPTTPPTSPPTAPPTSPPTDAPPDAGPPPPDAAPGTDCLTILQCSTECAGEQACLAACVNAGSPAARNAFLTWSQCAANANPSCRGWDACAEACPAEAAACGYVPGG